MKKCSGVWYLEAHWPVLVQTEPASSSSAGAAGAGLTEENAPSILRFPWADGSPCP